MTGDLTTAADLPEPFNERWFGRTLHLFNVDWYGPHEGTALVKAPDHRGAAALSAHLAGLPLVGFDLANVTTTTRATLVRFTEGAGGHTIIVRKVI